VPKKRVYNGRGSAGSTTTALPKSMSFTCAKDSHQDDTRGGGGRRYIEVAIHKDIFILDVAVRDALAVEVIDSFDDLRKHETCLAL
jgi:hypothetical protein